MPTSGQKISQEYFNSLIDSVNELYGDTHAGEGPSSSPDVQDAIRWGWGGDNVDQVSQGDKVTASLTNELVHRINISTLRTNSTDQELVVVARGDNITADFFNTATDLLDGARNLRNTVDPAFTELSTIGNYPSSTEWTNQFEIELDYDFGSYEDARYFFNAGGDLRFSFSLTGGYSAGYSTWCFIFDDMGTVKLDVGTAVSLNDRGISQDIGLSELTNTYQLLYTSPAGQNGSGCYGGYGGYSGYSGYSGYISGGYGGYSSSRAKLYAKIDGDKLVIKWLLDHSAMATLVRGDLNLIASMIHPTDVSESTLTLTLPEPTITIRTNWHEI